MPYPSDINDSWDQYYDDELAAPTTNEINIFDDEEEFEDDDDWYGDSPDWD